MKLASRSKKHKPVHAKRRVAGMVDVCVRMAADGAARSGIKPAELMQAFRDGLPLQELQALQERLQVTSEEMGRLLGMSKATLHRRKADGGRLSPLVSDRVARYARLLGLALRVFEDAEDARRWLQSPQRGLGGAAPLEHAITEIGAREVEHLLGRIEHGVYA